MLSSSWLFGAIRILLSFSRVRVGLEMGIEAIRKEKEAPIVVGSGKNPTTDDDPPHRYQPSSFPGNQG